MVLFYWVLLLAFVATVLAAVLGFRLERSQPGLYKRLDVAPWWSRGPHFWVYFFVSPSKLDALGRLDRLLAIASIALLSAGLLLAGFGIFDLARHGSL